MRDNLDATRKLVFTSEGGYVVDNGGPTNHGVTLTTLRAARKDPSLTADDVKALSAEEAWAIYVAKYLAPVWFDSLFSGLDYAMADFSVNSGPAQAVKTLQQVVDVPRDGLMGPVTLAAVQAYERGEGALINDLLDARLAFMKGLRVWSTYGKGWSNRIASVRLAAHRMHDNKLMTADGKPVALPGHAPPTPPVPGRAPSTDTKLSATPHGKTNIATAAGAVITAGASAGPTIASWATGTKEQLEPYAEKFPILHTTFDILLTLGLVGTVLGVIAGVLVTLSNLQKGHTV